MKPLSQQEYLIPVGNECCVPSMLEAFQFFTEQNMFGAIKFGVAHTDKGDSLCWLLIPPNGPLRPLKAFEDKQNAPVKSFKELAVNSYFIWREKYYQFIEDEELIFIIKELSCFSTETDVYGYTQSKEYGEVDIYAVKIYKIGSRQEYLFPAWYVKLLENEECQGIIIPMFLSDTAIMNDIDFNLLNWEFMKAGNIFLHEKELWKLAEDENNGLFINRLTNPFKISKHS